MANIRKPRYGSMQFWHRKRARSQIPRIRSWLGSNTALPLGFAGYKVGMTHAIVIDNSKTSLTKGEPIFIPITVLECPAIKTFGIRVYKNKYSSIVPATDVLHDSSDKHLSRTVFMLKKGKHAGKLQEKLQDIEKDIENSADKYSDITLLVHTQPVLCGFGKKKPEVFELPIGGNGMKEKISFAKEHLGKEMPVDLAFKEGQQVDVHAVTKGKGFQGPVKRFGVPIRGHKSEKTKRGPGSLGGWKAQAHITYRVAHAGQTGYHTRTEYNKWLIKIIKNPAEISRLNPESGFKRYGLVKNPVVLIKGSVSGPAKRLVRFCHAIRKNKWIPEEAPTLEQLCIRNKS